MSFIYVDVYMWLHRSIYKIDMLILHIYIFIYIYVCVI